MHHVTLPGHEQWLWRLLWRKGLWPKRKGAAALIRLCHLMTPAPDTAASGCLSWPVTTTLWWTVVFPSLLQKPWAARPIHQLSSTIRLTKRFPFFSKTHHIITFGSAILGRSGALQSHAPKQRAEGTAGLNSPPQNGAVCWSILVAKGPTLLPSTACSWGLHMAPALMGNGDLQLQMYLAMVGTGHVSTSLVKSFHTGFHEAQWRMGQGNARCNRKAS